MARKRRSIPGPFLLQVELLRERIPSPDRLPYNLPVLRQTENYQVASSFLSDPQRELAILLAGVENAEQVAPADGPLE